MRKLHWLMLGAMIAGLLWGCGSGPASPFGDFFGAGATPGGIYAVNEPGTIQGVILRRDRDGRILILGSADETQDATTPVQGATVSLVELQLTGITGATGRYTFAGLQPGEYTLRVTLPAALGGSTANFSLRVAAGQTINGVPAGSVH